MEKKTKDEILYVWDMGHWILDLGVFGSIGYGGGVRDRMDWLQPFCTYQRKMHDLMTPIFVFDNVLISTVEKTRYHGHSLSSSLPKSPGLPRSSFTCTCVEGQCGMIRDLY